MSWKNIAACAGCIMLGVVIGRMLPRETASSTLSGEALPAPGRGVAGEPAPTGFDPPSAGESRRHARPDRPEAKESAAAGEQGLVTVPAALIGELSLAAGARSGGQQLFGKDDRIGEILKITENEKARLQTAWNASREKIRALEAASMKAEPTDEWSVRVVVPDISDSLHSLGDGFRSKVREALGDNRGDAFMAAKQTDSTFAPPQGERSYTVTTEQIGDGNWRYRFDLDGPEGRRVWVGENIPEEIRHLTDAAKIQPLGQ